MTPRRPAGRRPALAPRPARTHRRWPLDGAVRRAGRPGGARDRGQIGILVLGLFALAGLLVLGGIDVTAAQLARIRLLDAADAAALEAASALDERAAYEGGVLDRLALTDASVAAAAGAHLSSTPLPPGIVAWSVVPDTGTPDGTTAVVTVQGAARLPMSGWVLDSLGGSVTITVTSRARARLR